MRPVCGGVTVFILDCVSCICVSFQPVMSWSQMQLPVLVTGDRRKYPYSLVVGMVVKMFPHFGIVLH